jgi:hypothetical protein
MTTFVTALHLETGHIVGVVSGGGEPSIEDLTGGSHLGVRIEQTVVRVPVATLTATRVAVDDGALEELVARPLDHRVSDAAPQLLFAGELQEVSAMSSGIAGTDCLVIFQDGDDTDVVRTTLDADGDLDLSSLVPGASWVALVAVPDQPLFYENASSG